MDKKSLDDYLKRSGDEKLPDGELIENKHGFCVYRYRDDAFVLAAVYGDGAYWNKWAEDKAKSRGLNKIMCATKRSPNAYIKKHGYHVVAHLLERTL